MCLHFSSVDPVQRFFVRVARNFLVSHEDLDALSKWRRGRIGQVVGLLPTDQRIKIPAETDPCLCCLGDLPPLQTEWTLGGLSPVAGRL